jgi:RND family efflux transporter MFP subunit
MSRRRWIALALVVVVVAVAVVVFLTRQENRQRTATAHLGSIDVTIQTVGTIQANNATSIRAAISGTVLQLGAAAGDDVMVGDIVVLLDRKPYEMAVAGAQDKVTQAEYAVQLAEQRSADSPDDMALKLDALSATNNLQQANDALANAQDDLRDTTILATSTGRIIDLPIKTGDTVAANQVVARITTPDQLELVADVDELDLPNVHAGAVVTFRLDAYPATEVTGSVLSTSPMARQQGGATVFSAQVRYDPPEGIDIRPGMNADVTIVTDQRSGVLLIPEGALKTVGERSFVDVKTSSGTTEREVKLGYRGAGEVEVVEGLSEGDIVILQ